MSKIVNLKENVEREWFKHAGFKQEQKHIGVRMVIVRQWTEDILSRIIGRWKHICTWDDATGPGLRLD